MKYGRLTQRVQSEIAEDVVYACGIRKFTAKVAQNMLERVFGIERSMTWIYQTLHAYDIYLNSERGGRSVRASKELRTIERKVSSDWARKKKVA